MDDHHQEEGSDTAPWHIPVLYQEVMHWLRPRPGGAYIDATVGLGGHARGILEHSSPDGRLLALDADPQALNHARRRLQEYVTRVVFARGRHADLGDIARQHGFDRVDGILLDLGVSSLQLGDPLRGFSFRQEGPLDMRTGPDKEVTAEEIVNTWPERELARIIYEYGEERYARRIARALCAQRPLSGTRELADLVARVIGRGGRRVQSTRIHPATRTFQALRIAVNDELGSLEAVLPQMVALLAPGARLVVVAFHSLEDRIVKRFIVRESKDCICPPRVPECVCGHLATLKRLTKKPIRPTEKEAAANVRSRSARMRVAERLSQSAQMPA